MVPLGDEGLARLSDALWVGAGFFEFPLFLTRMLDDSSIQP